MKPIQAALARLAAEAQRKPGQICTIWLAGRLKVDCKVSGGVTYVQVSRASILPSLQDWVTLQASWPQLFKAHPSRLELHGRHYLYACFPTNEKLPEFLYPEKEGCVSSTHPKPMSLLGDK